jgi:hypothetical protein
MKQYAEKNYYTLLYKNISAGTKKALELLGTSWSSLKA